MTKKEEIVKILNEISKWDSNQSIYSYPQGLLDIVYNKYFPMKYIQLGQPEDKFIRINELTNNFVYLGSNPKQHFVQIGERKILADNNLSVLIYHLEMELINE
jgi:hypothetical protein